MQGLGKMADPTGKVNRNLEYVSQTIDLMEMLNNKTIGVAKKKRKTNGKSKTKNRRF